MSDTLDLEFGRPAERELFAKTHYHFFERLLSLNKALDAAFPKVDAQFTNPDIVVLTLCKICVNDFKEIVLLCGNGFGNSALKLLRSMFENLVVARYLHLHPEEVDKFWKFHTVKLSKLKLDDTLKKIDPEGDILNRFRVSRKDSGRKRLSSSWHNLDFVRMAEEVGLSDQVRNAYHLPLEYAHPSVTSILSVLKADGSDLAIKDDEPQRDTAEIAFPMAYYLLLEVLRLLVEHFKLDGDDPIFQQCLDDYKYVMKGERSLTQKYLEPTVDKPRRDTGKATYNTKPKQYVDESAINAGMERSVGVTVEDLTNLYVLESLKGFGPQKFKELYLSKIRPADVIRHPQWLPIHGKRGDTFRTELSKVASKRYEECRHRAINQIITASKYKAVIITYDNPAYPRNVFESNNPIPVLYVRGSLEVLKQNNAVACVGSRNIRPPYSDLHAEFARIASQREFIIVSGFAMGADTIGHETAFKSGGSTICVMPSGLERPFPPENKYLWEDLLNYKRAAFVTEFPFGIRAASLTLRKRNKLIVAFARGVLIGQSSVDGGAMNAYRFAREQHKPVATFAEDESKDTSGNKLISQERELNDVIFPIKADLQAYEQWLQGLYSST